MILEESEIVWNRPSGESYRHMGIKTGAAFETSVPGQFVMVKVGDGFAPLLRRPFSIHRLIDADHGIKGMELLYKIVGPTTRKMGGLGPGDTLSVLGPLGRGFAIPFAGETVALAGGGIGIAPLLFLAVHLIKNGIGPDRIRVFLGGRSAEDLLCAAEFKKMGLRVVLTTDDGSAGQKGLVTRPLENSVKAHEVERVYACGPTGMLKGVFAIAAKYQVTCQVSIETLMACGMGACMGCAVKSKPSRGEKCRHACLDGPVFDAGQIILE